MFRHVLCTQRAEVTTQSDSSTWLVSKASKGINFTLPSVNNSHRCLSSPERDSFDNKTEAGKGSLVNTTRHAERWHVCARGDVEGSSHIYRVDYRFTRKTAPVVVTAATTQLPASFAAAVPHPFTNGAAADHVEDAITKPADRRTRRRGVVSIPPPPPLSSSFSRSTSSPDVLECPSIHTYHVGVDEI